MTRLGPGRSADENANAHFERLTFRFIVGVDVAGFSRCHAAEQARIQDDLESVLVRAAAAADLDRGLWYRQPRGDGELAVLPQGVDGLSLVADFPRKLASSIADLNFAGRYPQLRVRLAIHHGAVSPGRFGPVGAALVVLSRLVDAPVGRQQLRQRSDVDVALIVSAAVYEEVIQSRLHDLSPEDFRRVRIRAKGLSYTGFLYQEDLRARDYVVPGPREPATAEFA
jgi:hypothetical protein